MGNWDQIHAPWSEEIVNNLNDSQHGPFHPFTCMNNGDDVLIATRDGWICPKCSYTQNWAYTYQAGL